MAQAGGGPSEYLPRHQPWDRLYCTTNVDNPKRFGDDPSAAYRSRRDMLAQHRTPALQPFQIVTLPSRPLGHMR